MPRKARRKSHSGFYHIILRGNGKQILFEDDDDRLYFLMTLRRYRDELGFELHAYCLMSNHVHLLLKDTNSEIDRVMKKITVSYVSFFNPKYERTGHLFQDRYKSETVESDRYFLAVLRYIHQNPQNAGIAAFNKYKWSSHNEYMNNEKLVVTSFALELLGNKKAYFSFVNEKSCMPCLDINDKKMMSDQHAVDMIRDELGIKNVQIIKSMDKQSRDSLLKVLKEHGLSIRQIVRLTGIGKNTAIKA